MLKSVVFANAVATVGGIGYLFCALLAVTVPGFLRGVFQSWTHGLDLTSIYGAWTFGEFLWGLVTFVVTVWVGGWLLAWFYNRWSGAAREASAPHAASGPEVHHAGAH